MFSYAECLKIETRHAVPFDRNRDAWMAGYADHWAGRKPIVRLKKDPRYLAGKEAARADRKARWSPAE